MSSNQKSVKYFPRKTNQNLGSLLWSAVSLTPLTTKKVNFQVEYLREYEAICKKALTRVSGAQMELFDEKNQRSKIS
jgi:hypothetical protein